MRAEAGSQWVFGRLIGYLWLLVSLGLRADELALVGTWPGYHRGVPRQILVRGNLLYCVMQSGLAIYDLTDASRPVRVGEWMAPQGVDPWRVAVDGGRSVVLDSSGNVFGLDVSDPAVPSARASIHRRNATLALDLRGSLTALIVDLGGSQRQLEVWDLFTDSTALLRGTQVLSRSAADAGFVGSNVVAVLSTGGLTTYQLIEGVDMALLSQVDGNHGFLARLRTHGTRALVTPGPLKVFEFSAPTAPQSLSDPNFGEVYVASELDGETVRAVVGANLDSYRREGTQWSRTRFSLTSDLAQPKFLAADGNRVVVGSPAPGLQILDSTRPTDLVAGARMNNFGAVSRVKMKGQYAYLADGTGIQVLSLTNPANPSAVHKMATTNSSTTSMDLDLRGDLLVTADRINPVKPSMFDVSTPESPRELPGWFDGYVPLNRGLQNVRFVRERDILVLDQTGSARILVGDTPNHWRLEFIQIGVNPVSLVVCGTSPFPAFQDVVTLTEDDRILMADPFSSFLSGDRFTLPDTAQGMTLVGNHTYVACGAEGLVILEGNGLGFRQLGKFATLSPATSVAVDLPYAFVGTSDGGVEVLDVMDVAQPKRLTRLLTAGAVVDIEVSGSTALVSKGDFGLAVMEFRPSRVPQRIRLAPLYDRPTNSPPFAIHAESSAGLPISLRVLAGPAEVEGLVCRPTGRRGRVLVRAENSGNETTAPAAAEGFFTFTRPLTNGFQNWVYTYFPQIPADQRGVAQDPDEDGVPNETEHYFGTDPSLPDDPARLPLPHIDDFQGNQFLVIEFAVRGDPWAPLQWSRQIQMLTNLAGGEWTGIPEEWVTQVENRVRVRVPLSSGSDVVAPASRLIRVGPRSP